MSKAHRLIRNYVRLSSKNTQSDIADLFVSIPPKTDWIYFLHRLGRAMQQAVESGLKPCAFLSVPFLDYSSILVASGILAEKYRDRKTPYPNVSDWGSRIDQPISFPVRIRNGGNELRRWVGLVAGTEDCRGEPCLVAKTLDGNGKKYTRFVESRWLSSVRTLEELPDLDFKKHGSLLAENIEALDLLLGTGGVECLLEKATRDCLLVDIKKRTSDEAKEAIKLSRLRVGGEGDHRLVLRDLVRLDSEGPAAMVETACCRISSEPEAGWPATVISGSLNFIRSWDDCDSPLRVAILSPSENAYADAIEEANRIYYQRHKQELVIPPEILAVKPPTLDIQVMFLPL